MQPALFKDEKPLRLTMALSGTRVLLEADVKDELLASAISRLGIELSYEIGMLSIHVRDLRLLRALHIESAVCDYLLSPLWAYSEFAHDSTPAVLEVVSGDLRLAWTSDTGRFDEVLDNQAIAALLASDLPFAASDQAWALLSRHSSLPVVVATARKSPYGFYLLQSSKPQLLAAAPLPGLFQVSHTVFGVSSAYEKELLSAPGVKVEKYLYTSKPEVDDSFLKDLSDSTHATALDVLECLQNRSGVVLVSPPGSSRRVSALAALAALGATPVLVVSPPWGVWAYRRAADFLGVKESVQAITPKQLTSMTAPPEFGSVIIDDPLLGQVSYNEAISRLDSVDTYKVAVCSSWPVSETEQLFLLARIRPQEFDDKVPVSLRYPHSPHERFTEHLRPFVRRSLSASGSSSLSVEVFDLPSLILEHIASNSLSFKEVSLSVSFGTPQHTSPKFAAAVSHINRCRQLGKTAVVLSVHRELLEALSGLMSPLDLLPLDASRSKDGLALCLMSKEIPDLSGFNEVILVEWPESIALLEKALANPGDSQSRIVILHARSSIDDVLAQDSLRD